MLHYLGDSTQVLCLVLIAGSGEKRCWKSNSRRFPDSTPNSNLQKPDSCDSSHMGSFKKRVKWLAKNWKISRVTPKRKKVTCNRICYLGSVWYSDTNFLGEKLGLGCVSFSGGPGQKRKINSFTFFGGYQRGEEIVLLLVFDFAYFFGNNLRRATVVDLFNCFFPCFDRIGTSDSFYVLFVGDNKK